MSLRDERQQELADKWIEKGEKGIVYSAPRTGKSFIGVKIMQKLDIISVLIAYPDNKIKEAWEDTFLKNKYRPSVVVYTTYLSLHKCIDAYDLVILDEIHLLSEAQVNICVELFKNNERILGLTGTLSSWTERVLREDLQLKVVARYSIEQAIEEGILPDYEINVVKTSLDAVIIKKFGKKFKTEKGRFGDYKWVIDKLEKDNKPSFHMKLKLIETLQNSIAKREKTVELIRRFSESRLLVFCGRTEIADNLGIPSYHSKSKEKYMWEGFINGAISHLAVVKIGNTGVTYTPLNKVIVNYFDSNSENMTQKIMRCLSLEYDNPEKKAVIYIVSSNEEIEIKWLNKALAMFDKNKIKYV